MDWPHILVILGIAVILYLIGSLRVLRQYERGHCTSGGDFSLSQECIMKFRWALFSAAILIGLLPSQVTSEEAVLGQGNISCGSWIENRRDNNPLAATRTAWVLGFITAFNQYGTKPQRDVSGGKDTEVLMARIDDHCKRHPLDNLYKAAAALVDELRQ